MVGAAAALQPLQSTSSMTLPAGSPLAVLRSYHRHLVTPAVNDGRMDLHVPTSALRRRGACKGTNSVGVSARSRFTHSSSVAHLFLLHTVTFTVMNSDASSSAVTVTMKRWRQSASTDSDAVSRSTAATIATDIRAMPPTCLHTGRSKGVRLQLLTQDLHHRIRRHLREALHVPQLLPLLDGQVEKLCHGVGARTAAASLGSSALKHRQLRA